MEMNRLYSVILRDMITKTKNHLSDMETVLTQLDNMSIKPSGICSPVDNDNDMYRMMDKLLMLERRLTAVELSKNIYVKEEDNINSWFLGEEGPLDNEVVDLAKEDESSPVIVKMNTSTSMQNNETEKLVETIKANEARKAEEVRKVEEARKVEEEQEDEDEQEEEEVELIEFEYKGVTYFRDGDNLVYTVNDEGELDETPVGRYNEKTSSVKMFAK